MAMSDENEMKYGGASLLSRRQALARLGGGLGSIALASAVQATEPAAVVAPGKKPHHRPRAKRVIQLFMNGGPFQGDFFDPKPNLNKYAGQRPAEVQLRTENVTGGLLPTPTPFRHAGKSGLEVSELLPHFSEMMDEVCVLRSMYTDNPNHGPALFMMNSGTMTPTRPSMGAWMLYGLGSINQNLPGYVVLCPGRPVRFSELWASSFLPGEYQGTYINHANLDPTRMIPFLRQQGRTPETQERQLALLKTLAGEQARQDGGESALDARIRAMETAFRMQFAATDAFDIRLEPQAVREEYGSTPFANGCLMARRLAERDVRVIQVYYGDGQPWDTHANHNEAVKGLAKDIDRPMAALLRDLKRRGMLEDTLVLWGGEFGRTPTTEGSNGRDHNHFGFTMWAAGGGIKAGTTYGASDDFGFQAAQDKMHIHDLHATILHLMGIDHERLTYRYAGRDFRLTDVAGRVVTDIFA